MYVERARTMGERHNMRIGLKMDIRKTSRGARGDCNFDLRLGLPVCLRSFLALRSSMTGA